MMKPQSRLRAATAIAMGAGLASMLLVSTPAQAATFVVSDQSSLLNAVSNVGSGDTIDFSPNASITMLTANVGQIANVTDLTINGNGAEISGDDSWGGLVIVSSEFTMSNLEFRNMSGVNSGNPDGLQVRDSSAQLTNVTATFNARDGLSISTTAAGQDVVVDEYEAVNNAGDGLDADINNSSLTVTNSLLDQSLATGFRLNANNAVISIEDTVSSQNQIHGFFLDSNSASTTESLSLSGLEANDNDNIGFSLQLRGTTSASADDLQATSNGFANFNINMDQAPRLTVTNSEGSGSLGAGAIISMFADSTVLLSDFREIGAADEGILLANLGTTTSVQSARLTIEDSTVDGAKVGIDATANSNTTLAINSSTFSNGVESGTLLAANNNGSITIENSTIVDNGDGSASNANFFNLLSSSASIAIANSTLAGNEGSVSGTGVNGDSGWAGFSAENSIFSGNTSGDDLALASTISGSTVISSSLVETVTPGSATDTALIASGTNVTGVSPDLGPLQSNGGPTYTMLPNDASPVINAGDQSLTALTLDQRGSGYERVSGSQIDMGATELQAPEVLDTSLPDGEVGTGYTHTATSSGEGTRSWSATGLPSGLAIDPASGEITGTPTSAGTYNVTITVTNAAAADSVTLRLVVASSSVTDPDPSTDPGPGTELAATGMDGSPFVAAGGLGLLLAAFALLALRRRYGHRLTH